MSGAEIWQHANDTLKIVLWPAVIGWIFFILRHKIKDRMSDLESVELPGGSAKFGVRKELAVASAVAAIVNRTSEADDPLPIEGKIETEDGQPPTASADLLDVREDIEEIIRKSFEAGVTAGQDLKAHGPDRKAEVRVTWTGSQPEISYRTLLLRAAPHRRAALRNFIEARLAESDGDPTAQADRRWRERVGAVLRRLDQPDQARTVRTATEEQFGRALQVASIEAEIERLLKEVKSPDALGTFSADELSARLRILRSLQDKLLKLDPASPWLEGERQLYRTGICPATE